MFYYHYSKNFFILLLKKHRKKYIICSKSVSSYLKSDARLLKSLSKKRLESFLAETKSDIFLSHFWTP